MSGCQQREFDLTKEVWSTGSTSDAVFIPYLRLPTNEAARAKVSFLVLSSPSLECRRGWRHSNDGVTWTAAAVMGGVYTGTGTWSWGTYYLFPYTNYRLVEFGLLARNSSGTNMEAGKARMIISLRDDALSSFGSLPTAWGFLEHGATQAADENRIVYTGTTSPYGDNYDAPGYPWTLAQVAVTVGNPSGPCAGNNVAVFWIGYDLSLGEWGVYTDTSWYANSISRVGSLAGGPNAVARVSVDGSGAGTFEVSFDGVLWNTLYTDAGPFNYRCTVVRYVSSYTVLREQRS